MWHRYCLGRIGQLTVLQRAGADTPCKTPAPSDRAGFVPRLCAWILCTILARVPDPGAKPVPELTVQVILIAQVTHGEEGYMQICKGMSLAWLAG